MLARMALAAVAVRVLDGECEAHWAVRCRRDWRWSGDDGRREEVWLWEDGCC